MFRSNIIEHKRNGIINNSEFLFAKLYQLNTWSHNKLNFLTFQKNFNTKYVKFVLYFNGNLEISLGLDTTV